MPVKTKKSKKEQTLKEQILFEYKVAGKNIKACNVLLPNGKICNYYLPRKQLSFLWFFIRFI